MGKTVKIALDRLVKRSSGNAVNPREIGVQNHLLIAQGEDQAVNFGKMSGGNRIRLRTMTSQRLKVNTDSEAPVCFLLPEILAHEKGAQIKTHESSIH